LAINVVFAVPSYKAEPGIEYNLSSLGTEVLLRASGINTIWRTICGDPYIAKARNRLATDFLHRYPNATDFFLVDDDIGWPPEAALRIVQRPEDVVCGVYPRKTDRQDFPCELVFNEDGTPVTTEDGVLIKANLIPTGFMRIKRHVIERVAEDSGIYPDPDTELGSIDCYDIFRTGFVPFEAGGRKGRWWGEDYFFSIHVRHLGMELWVDPDIEFTHAGRKVWRGNIKNMVDAWTAQQQQKMAAE